MSFSDIIGFSTLQSISKLNGFIDRSNSGLKFSDCKYTTTELLERVAKPCAKPSGIKTDKASLSVNFCTPCFPYVLESFLISTNTSKISPLIQVINFLI